MAEYPYIMVSGKLKEFLSHIQSAGVPQKKVNRTYLEMIGYKSQNDRPIPSIMQYLGFIDSQGIPTELWRSYRDKAKAPNVLGSAIRQAYSDLYDTYPDAHRRDNEALTNFFRAKTSLGDRAVQAIVQTFKTVADLASFDTNTNNAVSDDPPSVNGINNIELTTSSTGLTKQIATIGRSNGIAINIIIEIAVPETTNPEVYDNFFKSLKKHILSDE